MAYLSFLSDTITDQSQREFSIYKPSQQVSLGRMKTLDLSVENVAELRYDNDCEFYYQNFFEYEQGNSEPIVRGRMKANIEFWKLIGAPDFIIDTIERGYKIPFISTAVPAKFKNNRSAFNNSAFVTEAINDLLAKDLISEISDPDIVNPLTVSIQSSGKKRLILDLRYVNHNVWKQKTKFEDWSVAIQYFNQSAFMFSFDLKSGYHHIDIFPEHRKFLSFSWEFNGITKYFSFNVLPFDLSSAPYIFTKCLRPLIKHWRANGLFIVVFLDDGWGTASSFNECEKFANSVKCDLLSAGFVPNVDKSVWTPVQDIDWLGMTWNSDKGTLKIIQRRIDDTVECINEILHSLPRVTARQLARFVGKVISLKPVVGYAVQLRTRFSSIVIAERVHWDKVFMLDVDSEVGKELLFWKENVNELNCRFLFHYSLPQVIVYSDASATGCGAWADCAGMKFRYSWSSDEVGKSSTWRELRGVALALEAFSPNLRGKCVKVHSDNKGVEAVIQKGSMKKELHVLSTEIASLCKRMDVKLQVQWVPREQNVQADLISREIDLDDWSVSDRFFNFIDNLWGPHSVDRFADNINCKLPKFNSKFWCPNTYQVDAFSVSWEGEVNWLVPPISIIAQAIMHVRASKAIATLVAPAWPSSLF